MIANLTFDEPTEDERLYVLNRRTEILGAKKLSIADQPFRVLVWRYGDGSIAFKAHHRKQNGEQINVEYRYTPEFVESRTEPGGFWAFYAHMVAHKLNEHPIRQ